MRVGYGNNKVRVYGYGQAYVERRAEKKERQNKNSSIINKYRQIPQIVAVQIITLSHSNFCIRFQLNPSAISYLLYKFVHNMLYII
jgi:hypothetical protein